MKLIYKIVVCPETSEFWFVSDLDFYVQENKRLIEYSSDGSKRWYLNKKIHRTDGPAIEFLSGSKFWYLNGKLHRENGPAIECSDGTKYWFLNNKVFSEKEFKELKNAKQ